MPPFYYLRVDDHTGNFRPAPHLTCSQKTARHQPDEKAAKQSDCQAEDY